MKLDLQLPCPPNRANDASGWRGRHFGKQKYFRQCAPYLLKFKADLRQNAYKLPLNEFIFWTAHFEVAKMYDADNLAALCKWPLDALVNASIILDDSHKNMWPKDFPTQEIKAKRGYQRMLKLELHIQEIGHLT